MSPESINKSANILDQATALLGHDMEASQSPKIGHAFSPAMQAPSSFSLQTINDTENVGTCPEHSTLPFPILLQHQSQRQQLLSSLHGCPTVHSSEFDALGFSSSLMGAEAFGTREGTDIPERSIYEEKSQQICNNQYKAGNRLPCIAGPGIRCYCEYCSAIEDSHPKNIIHTANAPGNSVPKYHFAAEDPSGQFLPPSTIFPSEYQQTSSTYNWIDWSDPFTTSSYVSMPASFNTSTRSPNLSSDRVPESSWSTTLSTINPGLQPNQSGMGDTMNNRYHETLPSTFAQSQNLPKKDRPRRRPALRNQASVVLPVTEGADALNCADFLKVQKYLSVEPNDGNPLSNAKKENLSKFLGISQSQLESCIKARHEILPIFVHLSSAVCSNGLPTDQAAQWFVEEQSHHSTSRKLNDSAYHSKIDLTEENHMPMKKRRRTTGYDHSPKSYQCTFIYPDRHYCEREIANYSDWKRHEETHWPQRNWVCLCTERNGAVVCHFCSGHIDLAGQPSTTSHDACIGRSFRKGHSFPRKDKLFKHVREVHGCEANIDLWHVAVISDWKEECGFCGSDFSNWEERCQHVGLHFTDISNPKRMKPDWKDPWPKNTMLSQKKPGDDNDDDQDGKDDEDDLYGAPPQRKRRLRPRNSSQSAKKISDRKESSDNGSNCDSNSGTNSSKSSASKKGQCRQHDPGNSREKSQFQIPHRPFSNSQDPPNSEASGRGVFIWMKNLGHGAFGTVDEVEHLATKTHFARKTARITGGRGPPALAQAQREVAALRKLKHPHIINIVASYTWGSNFSIIMFPVAEHNLSELLLDENATSFMLVSKLSLWIGCLTSAVSYMHEKSWHHLDIKPSNILVTGSHVMLSDFGGALNMEELQSKDIVDRGCTVTPMYCAPEISSQNKVRSLSGACDIWSLGCVFLEMVTFMYREKVRRFDEFRSFGSGDGTYHKNSQKISIWISHLWDINESIGLPPPNGLQIISSMLSTNWKMRPSAANILDSDLMHNLLKRCFTEERYFLVTNIEHVSGFVEVIKDWLRTCWMNHKQCSTLFKGEFLPSRLLNVGKDRNFIYLQSTVLGSTSSYVALSYCWGSGKTLKTTTETLDKMSKGIAISSLSNTFVNAIRVTRALGLKYLWIDAFCIVQDSIDDWTAECSQMAKIYSHSSLTISVLGDCEQAAIALEPKYWNQKLEVMDPCMVCSSCPGNGSRAFDPLVTETTTTMMLNSSWWKRAWTYQEAILSPRILYYSSSKISWECNTGPPKLDTTSLMRRTIQSLASPLPTTPSASNDFRKIWHTVVRNYSKRQLSYPEDKIPALAGVASFLADASKKTYVAGLWKEDLIHHPTELLWCRDFASTPIAEPEYRAPTWSWASIEGAVLWPKDILTDLNEDLNAEVKVKVLDCHVNPISEINPYGGVKDGYIQIWGLQLKVMVVRPNYEQLVCIDSGAPFAFAQWDVLHTVQNILGNPVGEENCARVLEVVCLRILPTAGLILIPKKENGVRVSGIEGAFERVGIYWNHDDGSPLTKVAQDSGDWKCGTIIIL